MGKKKNKEITKENKGLNVLWFLSSAIIICLLFFSIRSWVKGAPHEPFVPTHLRKKVKVKVYQNHGKNKREASSYNLSYSK